MFFDPFDIIVRRTPERETSADDEPSAGALDPVTGLPAGDDPDTTQTEGEPDLEEVASFRGDLQDQMEERQRDAEGDAELQYDGKIFATDHVSLSTLDIALGDAFEAAHRRKGLVMRGTIVGLRHLDDSLLVKLDRPNRLYQ